jgi:16S rRNA C967 or C1407 C5-methylase (RsmB/RsmF family)
MNGTIKYSTLEEAEEVNRKRALQYYYTHKQELAEYRKKYYAENREKLILQKRLKRRMMNDRVKNIKQNSSNCNQNYSDVSTSYPTIELVIVGEEEGANIQYDTVEKLINNGRLVLLNGIVC